MKRILIVEDDEVLAHLCKINLQKNGHVVDVVHDGGLALHKVDAFSPHLIILDIILPNKNGFDILQEIKKSEKHKDIDVIVYSSLSQQEDIDTFSSMGAVASNSKKDVGAHELAEHVHLHINKKQKIIS